MPRTDNITVTVKGLGAMPQTYVVPHDVGRKLADFLMKSADDDISIPAEIVLPDLDDPVKGPASALRGSRYRAGLTQKQLADKSGIRQHHLSEMENGKRIIGKATAQKLAGVFDCDFRIFM
jgi:DNA-binding XRE family transcriptional regulator